MRRRHAIGVRRIHVRADARHVDGPGEPRVGSHAPTTRERLIVRHFDLDVEAHQRRRHHELARGEHLGEGATLRDDLERRTGERVLKVLHELGKASSP
jgi:hypothetical protein